jgi:hypothetical protein
VAAIVDGVQTGRCAWLYLIKPVIFVLFAGYRSLYQAGVSLKAVDSLGEMAKDWESPVFRVHGPRIQLKALEHSSSGFPFPVQR